MDMFWLLLFNGLSQICIYFAWIACKSVGWAGFLFLYLLIYLCCSYFLGKIVFVSVFEDWVCFDLELLILDGVGFKSACLAPSSVSGFSWLGSFYTLILSSFFLFLLQHPSSC